MTQLASALALCVAAILLYASAINVTRIPLGFDTEGTWAVHLATSRMPQTPMARLDHLNRLVEHIRRMPGVEHAALSSSAPLLGSRHSSMVRALDSVNTSDDVAPLSVRPLTPGYFETMGIRLIAGRVG